LQLTGQGGYLLAGGRLYAGPVTTGRWRAVRVTQTAPSCLTSSAPDQVTLIAPGQDTLYLACGTAGHADALGLYASFDGGTTWRSLGATPVPAGAATSLAVSPAGPLVLAARTGIYYSAAGRSWRPAVVTTPAGGFGFVGMTTATNGVAVQAHRGPAVYITTDGGLTWHARPIR
jgi:photosystem II stability/assembly factor-like uncharacterized protein